ncbi:MAG: hypothetical protein OEV08_05130 [Nitrospira sp.]|nr:hypothetical protein [Nitrospira sp.]
MTPTIGNRIQWRRADGRMVHMLVDLIHDTNDERWLFGTLSVHDGFVAVNQKYVLGVKRVEVAA